MPKIFSIVINNTSPSFTQRMDAFLEEFGRLRLEEVGYPILDFIDAFELFFHQGALH